MRRRLAILALFLVPLSAVAQDSKVPLAPGSYTRAGGSGTLVIKRPNKKGGLAFAIESVGANGHSCALDGTIVSGKATLAAPEGDGAACVVRFQAGAKGVEVSPVDSEPCRGFCGMRAGFDGLYVVPPPECVGRKLTAAHRKARQLHERKSFAEARAILEPLLSRCGQVLGRFTEMALQNDLAVTLHRLGDDAACTRVLEGLRDLADTPEEEVGGTEPAFADELRRLWKATRFNMKLCGVGKR